MDKLISEEAMQAAAMIDRCVARMMHEAGYVRVQQTGQSRVVKTLSLIVQDAIDRSMDRVANA